MTCVAQIIQNSMGLSNSLLWLLLFFRLFLAVGNEADSHILFDSFNIVCVKNLTKTRAIGSKNMRKRSIYTVYIMHLNIYVHSINS